ncbi:ATP-dependent nuclease [Kaistia sp. MMO-174]|uniref:ATP-dependent nuclease n=1 Tax=Kaistia sp. MMO-174 TaxID=3081256 RepID=UPI0030199331
MARLRKIEISHFRSIKSLSWLPRPGLNCLIGPGDSGKSTVLDAIDLCLGARRAVQFNDADFHSLDVTTPISITLTIGALDDALKSFDSYSLYLRGFNVVTGEIEDEPERGLETVLSLNLTVGSDLEPSWNLISDRAQAQGAARNLAWGDRLRLAPTRIGALTDFNLNWRRGSVLNRLTDERADASAALAQAARDARGAFGEDAEKQLGETLRLVGEAAAELGIDVGKKVRALLDAHSVSFGGGTISLHDEDGVPLRGLGIGSTRLLTAGLQRKAAAQSSMLLVDELEHGLEPHRIIRFLGSLGAKEPEPPLQVFMTTHSPVALRELSADQLVVLREIGGRHEPLHLGNDPEVQGTIRSFPEAFLASSVVVCEGASEVGLVRGLDQHWAAAGYNSVFASGTALVNAGGEKNLIKLANAFQSLRYRTAILRDDDVPPDVTGERSFVASGGLVVMWRQGRKLEEELFCSLPIAAIAELLTRAVAAKDEAVVNDQLKSASGNLVTLTHVRTGLAELSLSPATRAVLGKAAGGKREPWFKSVSAMEDVGREVIGPAFNVSEPEFVGIVGSLFDWAHDVR